MLKKLDKESMEMIKNHMMKGVGWRDRDSELSREDLEFKSTPPVGESLIYGGFVADAQIPHEYWVWARFNDLSGTTHQIKFRPYFLPKDPKTVAIQVIMHFNEEMGLSAWRGIEMWRKGGLQNLGICLIDNRLKNPNDE